MEKFLPGACVGNEPASAVADKDVGKAEPDESRVVKGAGAGRVRAPVCVSVRGCFRVHASASLSARGAKHRARTERVRPRAQSPCYSTWHPGRVHTGTCVPGALETLPPGRTRQLHVTSDCIHLGHASNSRRKAVAAALAR